MTEQRGKPNSLLFRLSAAAFCCLLVRPLPATWLLAPAFTALFCLALRRGGARDASPRLRGAALSLFLALVFGTVWLRSLRLVSLEFFDLGRAWPVLLAACLCGLLSLPFTSALTAALRAPEAGETPPPAGEGGTLRPDRSERVLIVMTAFVTVSVCSLSSPLYPFNDWVDANCFLTVGKSMWKGLVPYRDLYEQKGPLLYALYALVWPLSHRSFFGAWLLETAAAAVFLLFAYRSVLLLTGKRCPPALLLIAATVYTVPAFLKGGSAEELCLPLLMYALYTGLRLLKERRELRFSEALLLGLSSGAVLWIKYSMLGFYAGFILIPAFSMLRARRGGRLVLLLLTIMLGVALVSLPVLAYFGLNGALPSLWEAYFYNNLFVYGKSSTPLTTVRGLLSGAASMLTFNDATILLLLLGLRLLLRRRERAQALNLLLCFGFAFLLIYAGGINLKYYSLILCIFVPPGIALLADLAGLAEAPALPRRKAGLRTGLVTLLFVLSLFGNENRGMLTVRRDELPQYRFAPVIAETPGATLFNYGALDLGQYTVSDITPSCRYFCMLNLPSEEMFREMDRYMEEGVTDYIVSRGLPVESPCYTLVQTEYFTDDGARYPYYLYKRIEGAT